MVWRFALATTALVGSAINCVSQAPAGVAPIAFKGVTVIDPSLGRSLPDLTVVVRENRIVVVGPSASTVPPPGTRIIEGRGKFLIPGLWDMHTHLGTAGESALPMYVAAGVTGVRDMGSEQFEPLRRWRVEILSGSRVGPRIVAAGPIVDGPTPNWPLRVTVKDAEQGRQAVDSLAQVGVDFIKVHQQLGREAYFAVAAEARRLDLPFAGHVPVVVTGVEAANAGQRSLEHLTGVPSPADGAFGATVAAFARNRTWIDPTMVVYWTLAHLGELEAGNDPRSQYLSPSLRQFWTEQKSAWSGNMSSDAMRLAYMQQVKSLQALHRAGIPILTGTDLGFVFVYPGSSVHDELERLVEAGFAPMEALQAGTVNPARYLGRDRDLGSIAAGRLADLVLLDADPLGDIANIRRIDAVMANGRLFDRAELDRLMAQAAEDVKQ